MRQDISRRKFLATTAAAGATVMTPTVAKPAAEHPETTKV